MPTSQALRSRLRSVDGPSPLAVGILVLLGLATLAHPLVLWPHFTQTPYAVSGVERVDSESVEQDAVVDYADLPAAAKAAFDGEPHEFPTLWTGEDERALAVLQEHQYVQQDGRYYEYGLIHGDRPQPVALVVRLLLTVVGSVLVTFGALVAVTWTWRPLTPLRSFLVLAAVILGLSGMHTYDVMFSGARGSLPQSLAPFGVIALPVGVLAIGSLVRLRGRGILKSVVAVGIALLAVGTVVLGEPVVPLTVAAVATVVGAPWFALGYWLTDDSAASV